MPNTYTWNITPSGLQTLTVDGQSLSQVFTTLDWRLIGTDGATPQPNVADVYGQVALDAPTPSSFIAAASVTADDLVAWLTAKLGDDRVTALKANVDAKIAALQSPPSFTSCPITASA